VSTAGVLFGHSREEKRVPPELLFVLKITLGIGSRPALDQLTFKKAGHFVSVDLHLEVASGPAGPRRVEQALRTAILEGRLVPGERMPSTRALAQDVGVARNTVLDAYEQLAAEGYLTTRPGSGTFVSTASELGIPGKARVPNSQAERKVLNLRPGARDLSAFPRAAWLRATRIVLDRAPDSAFTSADPKGSRALRESVANYLARARGVMTDPEHIVICGGYLHIITMLGTALAGFTDTIAVEDPALAGSQSLWNRVGLQTHPIPVDGDGMQVIQLWESGARAALFTPRFHYPTGAVLSDERRREAVKWAQQTGSYIIEHEFDGEMRYDTTSQSTMRALDTEHIIYSESVTRTLTPGIRLGWIVLPDALIEPVVAAKQALDLHSSTMEQLTFAELIDSKDFDRQIRKTRQDYTDRRARLSEIAGLPSRHAFVPVIAAGLQCVIELPPDTDESAFVNECASAGLMVDPLSSYYRHPHHSPGIVVSFGTPAAAEFEECITLLLNMLRSVDFAQDH
jgi:GntR family transcriptional regulator/MocR family aminotransferase